MNWLDFLLGVGLLAIFPFGLAAYGGHLAAEMLGDPKRRRRVKSVFWGMCFLGVFVAAEYQYRIERADADRQDRAAKFDEERQAKLEEAQNLALKSQIEIRTIEKSNSAQILALQQRVEQLKSLPQSPEEKARILQMQHDLVAEVANAVKEQVKVPPAVSVTPTQKIQSATAPPPTPGNPCRGDHLSECSDTELTNWGAGLVARLSAIRTEYAKDQTELDQLKSPGLVATLFGKEDKWSKKFDEMQKSASDQYRDCCAEDALNYHRELALRTGGGRNKDSYYEWTQKLLKPVKSRDWREARQEGSNVVQIAYDLEILQMELSMKATAKIRSVHP